MGNYCFGPRRLLPRKDETVEFNLQSAAFFMPVNGMSGRTKIASSLFDSRLNAPVRRPYTDIENHTSVSRNYLPFIAISIFYD